MSLLGNWLNKKKIRLRTRPYTIEKEQKDDLPVVTSPDDRYCRICFDDKKREVPIMSCRCKVSLQGQCPVNQGEIYRDSVLKVSSCP